ncbi:hypothetical protein [Rhizobacter sp. SG703]|uniref:hypothetical protein n=1 Tax=Rhizobacter sp. SG703 TaxID=2587140 RepID=UPI00144823A4|nr:hypothetical protein [Rhizobacter sp. SG703]NKI97733.1 hypothetical protein [Rhizobacter sp. SG703]
MSIVVLSCKGFQRLIDVAQGACGFDFEGEFFALQSCGSPSWFGFYDWLRTSQYEIVGVRIKADSPELPAMLSKFIGNGVDVAGRVITIRTSKAGVVDESLSDDADFGGNYIFIGENGSIGIAFFSPDFHVNPFSG